MVNFHELSIIFHVRLFNLGSTFWRRCGLKSFNYYKHRWLNLSPQHANSSACGRCDDQLARVLAKIPTGHWWTSSRNQTASIDDRSSEVVSCRRWTPSNMQHLHLKRLEFSRVSGFSKRQVWSGWICSNCCCRHFSPRFFHGGQRRFIIFIKLEPELEPKEILDPSYPTGSMVLLYMVTWIPWIYPLYDSIYTSTMDPSWVLLYLFNEFQL